MTEQKKISRYLRCNDNHPTMIKYRQLADLADELGISLYFESGVCIVRDRDRDSRSPDLYLQDIEDQYVFSFPYDLDYKMIYDNPIYLEDQKKKHEEYVKKKEEEILKKKAEEILRKEIEERKRLEKCEASERTLLANLKKKYESS